MYNSYYRAVSQLIVAAQRGELNEKGASELIGQTAFSDSFVYILDAIKNQQWQVIRSDFKTPLKREPKRPLTLLERRWIAAVKQDRRMQLFEDMPPVTRGAIETDETKLAPLYRPQDCFTTDSARDGDPYEDGAYREIFRTVLAAVKEGREISVGYLSSKGRQSRSTLQPYRLEYSEKDDKFRLLARGKRGAVILNLARIQSCRLVEMQRLSFDPNHSQGKWRTKRKKVVLELLDHRNALERSMIHFTDLEKRTTQLSEGRYGIELFYRQEDEVEILIRILSFGPFLKVLEPAGFVKQLRERLEKQYGLDRNQ